MKRTRRLVFMFLVAGVVVAGVVAMTVTGAPPAVRSPVAEALRRSPTTRITASASDYLYRPSVLAPVVIAPPNTYYGMGSHIGRGVMGGDVNGGLLLWMSTAQGAYVGRPGKSLVRGGGLIFAINPAGGSIDAIDELSRGVLWSAPSALPPTKSLAWSDADMLLIAGGEGDLRAIDPRTGHTVWSVDLVGTIVSDVHAKRGKVIVAVNGDYPQPGKRDEPLVVAFNARDGKLAWRTGVPQLPVGIATDELARSVYCVGQDYFAPKTYTVSAIDLERGTFQWKSLDIPAVHKSPSVRARGPAAGGGIVCLAVENILYAVDCATGNQRWTWSLPGDIDNPPRIGQPLVRDGIVYFTVKNGAVGVDCITGQELWRFHRAPRLDEVRDPQPMLPPAIFGNLITLPYFDRRVDFVRLPTTLRFVPDPAAVGITPVMAILVGVVLVVLMVVAFIFRRVRLLVALANLLLLAITIGAWKSGYVASYFLGMKHFEYAGRLTAELDTGLFSADGALTIGRRRTVTENAIKQPTVGNSTASLWWTRRPPVILANGVCVEEPARDLGLRRFEWTHRARPSGTVMGEQAETSIAVPDWFAALLFGIPPLAWLSGMWRDRGRYPPGHCRNCGYDLRASSGKCPECGTVFVEGK